jgi:hypothetical protein
MNPLIQRTTILPLLIGLALACFGIAPHVRAVIPPPDGCYPSFTTAEGCNALNFLTTGAGNTALGWRSLFLNSTGSFNTGVGGGALAVNNGDSNTGVGAAALLLNTSGTENVAVGTDALVFNDSGSHNSAVGAFALFSNATGNSNNATGFQALLNNTTGNGNTANGFNALASNVDGGHNTAVGLSALFSNTGNENTAVGFDAGANLTTGDNNIDIGNNVTGVPGESNTIRIGNPDITGTYISGISGATAAGGVAVFITANGRLGTMTSSARFKEEIKPMGNASEALFLLKPVVFRYKKGIDPAGTPQLGLVAEEVEKVNPSLVVRDKEGKPYGVRYDQVNAMLLNEFLKEHRKVKELEATVAQQQKDFQAAISKLKENVTVQLKKQAAQIQMVSDELQSNRPAPFLVGNN